MSDSDDLERYAKRQAVALENIARSLATIAEHFLGGMSAEEVEAAKADAKALAANLKKTSDKLEAAIDAAKDK